MFERYFRGAALCTLFCAAVLLQVGAAHVEDSSPSIEARDGTAIDAPAPRHLARRSRGNTGGLGKEMTILLTSDSHGVAEGWKWKDMPAADLLIHCGDITDEGKIEEYKKVLPLFMKHPAKLKLFVGGNHDLSLDKPFFNRKAPKGQYPIPEALKGSNPKKIIDAAYALFNTPEALKAGVKLLDEGMHNLQVKTKGGMNARFRVFASPYTPEFHGWAFAYEPKTENRFDKQGGPAYIPSRRARAPHFVITHGPPKGILDQVVQGTPAGDPHLFDAMKRVKPLFHVFGHIHEAMGVLRKDWLTGKETKIGVDEKTIDLTKPGAAIKRDKETLFLNVAQRNLAKENVNPWRLLKINWVGVEKGEKWVDNNDPAKPRNKVKAKLQKAMGKTDGPNNKAN